MPRYTDSSPVVIFEGIGDPEEPWRIPENQSIPAGIGSGRFQFRHDRRAETFSALQRIDPYACYSTGGNPKSPT